MKRRNFLQCLGMAAVGFAAPRILIEGSLAPAAPTPIPNPSIGFMPEGPMPYYDYGTYGSLVRGEYQLLLSNPLNNGVILNARHFDAAKAALCRTAK